MVSTPEQQIAAAMLGQGMPPLHQLHAEASANINKCHAGHISMNLPQMVPSCLFHSCPLDQRATLPSQDSNENLGN